MNEPDAVDHHTAAIPIAECPLEQSSSSSSNTNSQSSGSQVLLHSAKEEHELAEPVALVEDMGIESSDESDQTDGNALKEYFCGVGKCRPKWMQVFRNSKFFTFILCLNCCIEGALVSGFTSVVLSSIERRYKFSSIWAGLIASSFDISVLVSVLFISYFGGRGHKPRWLGISLIIQGIGALVFSLPQFLFGPYMAGTGSSERFELCEFGSSNSSDSSPGCDANNFALAFFFIGNILIGIGAAPLFTVGTSYLDDIIHPKYVTIHLGLFYTFSVVGPSIGYGLGGAFLSIYVDPWIKPDLEPTDPGWVGAWWISFLFCAVVSWLFAIPFLMFPKLLPDSHLVKKERNKEMAQKYKGKDSAVEEVDLATKVKSFPQHSKQVLKTPSWLFITIAICFSTLVVSGVASFAPKYLESQFGLTASRASLIAGAVAIPSGGAGVFIGALIIYFTKSRGRSVALINWVVTLVALFPTFIFLLHCPTVELVGVTVEYPDSYIVPTSTSFMNASCIQSCNCKSARYVPVCGQDGYTYFTPCTAGCQNNITNNDTMETSFENCTCIADQLQQNETISLSDVSVNILNGTAVDGQCDQRCNKLGLFLGVLFFALLLIFILQVPNVVITVRCVADEQRTLALGMQSVAFRAFGSIPGPIVFGAIFDSACIYWQYECSRRGNCWVYNNEHLSQRAVILAMLGIATNFIFSLLAWLFYPKKTAMEKDAAKKVPLDVSAGNHSETGSDKTDSNDSVEPVKPSNRSTASRLDSHCSEDILLDSEM